MALQTVGAANVTSVHACADSGAPGTCDDLPSAVSLAQEVDVAVVVIGDSLHDCGEWGDRDSLDPAGGQLQLLEAVSAVAPVTVVVLIHGRPATFGYNNNLLANVSALLSTWRPGEEGGTAIVNILTGAVNPSGKLAQSWPRGVGQVMSGSAPWLQRVRGKWRSNSRGCDDAQGRCYDPYVDSVSTPLFPFAFGMSYTTFAYESLEVHAMPPLREEAKPADAFAAAAIATVTVRNTGKLAGQEVVQVYVVDPAGLPFVGFWRRLVGFAKVLLQPGESKDVAVPLLWADLAQYDSGMELRLFQGTYTVSAGGASNNRPVSANMTV